MNSINVNLFGDQLLVAVFSQFHNPSFRVKDESDIINAFFTASKSEKYTPLFSNYTFHTSGNDVFSNVLQEAIDSLQQSRLLGRMNPDLKKYNIEKPMKVRYERFIKDNLSKEEQALIISLSEDISKQLQKN